MDTNSVIDSLTADLKPVRVLPQAGLRTAFLCVGAMMLVAIAIPLLGGPRPDWLQHMQQPMFIGQSLAMIAAGAFAAYAGFILSVPDTKIRKPVIALLCLSTLIWVGFCVEALTAVTQEMLRAEFAEMAQSSACVKALAVMTALPLIAAFRMASRGAAVWAGWAGYALVLSMASFGALGMRFFCPSDAPQHLLLWHFMPIILFALIGALLGKAFLRFRG